MTFAELRQRCDCANFALVTKTADGGEAREEILTLYTVNAGRRLARYDEAEVARIRPGVSTWEGEIIAVLEVELDV